MVSHEYPNSVMMPISIKVIDPAWSLDDEFFESLIAADCWGVRIVKGNGRIVPVYNTYALLKKHGTLHIHNDPQCACENEMRQQLIDNPKHLVNLLEPGDTAEVWMFEDASWTVTATRTPTNDIQYNAYATPEFHESCLHDLGIHNAKL